MPVKTFQLECCDELQRYIVLVHLQFVDSVDTPGLSSTPIKKKTHGVKLVDKEANPCHFAYAFHSQGEWHDY